MQWWLNFYNSIGEVSSFRDFSLQILICKINYNKSEQISCRYFIYYFFTLTYAILLMQYAHMIMADHALFINHCTACFLFHVFPWIVHIHMYGKKSWSLCALCLMLLFCTCISHMGTNHHIVLVCFICVFIWKMWYLEHVQNATKSFLVDVRAIQGMLMI